MVLMFSLFRVSAVATAPLSEASLHDSVSVQLTYNVNYLDGYKFFCLHSFPYTFKIYQSAKFNAFTIFNAAQQILLYRVNFQFTHLQRDLHHRSSHLLGPLLMAIHRMFTFVLRAAKATANDFSWRRFHLCSQSRFTLSLIFISFIVMDYEPFIYPNKLFFNCTIPFPNCKDARKHTAFF
jgi:hypothetical protein